MPVGLSVRDQFPAKGNRFVGRQLDHAPRRVKRQRIGAYLLAGCSVHDRKNGGVESLSE